MFDEPYIYILVCVAGYLIGSISPAIIISYNVAKKDIRRYGSGNAGTSNMIRTFGWGMGLATFLLDVLKGAVVVLFAGYFAGDLGSMLGAICVVIGHNWPVYYNFRGGKGIAATLGVIVVVMTVPGLIVLAFSLLLVAITGIMSIGSMVGVVLCAAVSFVIYPDNIYLQIAMCVLAAIGLFVHRTNIVRLCKGTENRLPLPSILKKKKKNKA